MAFFVQLASFTCIGDHFDEDKDTKRLNAILSKLQSNGARVVSVTHALGGSGSGTMLSGQKTLAVYVVSYEAQHPITV